MTAVTLLDRAAPDGVCTTDLPPVIASEIDLLAGRVDRWLTPSPPLHRAVVARALLVAGRHDEARATLGSGRAEAWTPQGVAAAVWVASRLDLARLNAELSAALDAVPPENGGFLYDADVPLGPRSLFRGLLLVASGNLDGAEADLTEAVAVGDARAPVWGARARLELHRVQATKASLIGGSAPPPVDRGVLVSARMFFAAGGYHHLRAQAMALTEPPPLDPCAHPTLGHLVLDGDPVVGFGVQPPTAAPAGKGLLALHHLLTHRHRGVPAVEIDRLLDGDPVPAFDADLIARLEGEDAAAESLRGLLHDDSARSRVSKLLRRTIRRIAEHHPVAGLHLSSAVETGYVCRYEADGQVRWRL